MKQRLLIFLILIFLLSIGTVAAQSACVYFFYGTGCPHCARAEPVIDRLEAKYPDLEVHRFEIYQNKTNALMLQEFFEVYNMHDNDRGVPVAFVNDRYLVGDIPIINDLENEILSHPDAECPLLQVHKVTGIVDESSPTEKLSHLSFTAIVAAAFVDSINPCAIAVLLILLASLFLVSEKGKFNRALKAGFAFIISIYIMYFMFGLGILAFFKEIIYFWGAAANFVRFFIGGFAIVIGLFNIKDFFWYGAGGFVMEIPRRWRPTLKKMLSNVTSPLGAFIIGFFVSAFELPCTGGPYFFVIGYLADKVTYSSIIPVLLLYNFIFVLPLIVINIFMYYGITSIEKAEQWKTRNIRLLHLVAGIIMFVLGILVLIL